MDATSLNTLVTVIAIVITVGATLITIIATAMSLRRRRVKPHWTTPNWTLTSEGVGSWTVPQLRVDWGVRGDAAIHDVTCSVRNPKGAWSNVAWPKGTVEMGKKFFTRISLLDGRTSNSSISSPSAVAKPRASLTDRAVKGKYTLRIQWTEEVKPSKVREKSFSHTVK